MLNELIRANEDLIGPGRTVQHTDHMVDEGRVRRVTLYWISMGRGNYGPNGFTADLRKGRNLWLVRAVSGVAVKDGLMPGAAVDEWELVKAAQDLFKGAVEEKDDQEHRRAEDHEAGLRL